MKNNKLKVKINSDFFQGHKKGQVVFVDADKNGKPTAHFWRLRFKDAEQDNCCEIVKDKKKNSNKKNKEGEKEQ